MENYYDDSENEYDKMFEEIYKEFDDEESDYSSEYFEEDDEELEELKEQEEQLKISDLEINQFDDDYIKDHFIDKSDLKIIENNFFLNAFINNLIHFDKSMFITYSKFYDFLSKYPEVTKNFKKALHIYYFAKKDQLEYEFMCLLNELD